jgi:SNF2 family DNA or RNA helicase
MKAAEDFVRAHNGKVLMVVDESTTIKNPSASRSKAARLLGSKVRYRMIMSGTPKPKSPVDLFGQYMFLDESILGTRYRTVFERRYCAMGGFQNKSVIGFTAQGLRDFQERVAPYTVVKFKRDCLDLPEKQYLEHVFEMTPEQRRAFRSMKETLRADFANGVYATAATAATALIRLQQITNGYITNTDGTITQLPGGRIDALMDLISSLESEDKIVIWCRFREDIQAVMSRLHGAVEYHGGVSSKDRVAARDRFLDPASGVRFFVGNPSVGGFGLNLQGRCRVAIYYSNSFDAEDRWQSEDRIHRIGMGDAALYYDMIAKGGIDRKIISNLRNKRSISDLTLASIRGIIDDE